MIKIGNVLPVGNGLFHVVLKVTNDGSPLCWCALSIEEARLCAEYVMGRQHA